MVQELTEKDFTKITSTGKVLVDCYADWCGPCRMLSPIIDDIATTIKDTKFYKLNIDNAEEIAIKFGIMSIPTILIFENGNLKNQIVGLRDKEELIRMIEE